MAIFEGKTFAISKTENTSIADIIKSNGGKVVSKLSKRVDYFIQSYDIEDDDRLGPIHDLHIQVVPSAYIKQCVHEEAVLDFSRYSFRSQEKMPQFEAIDEDRLFSYFSLPHDDCREREEQPQTVIEFENMERYSPDETRMKIYLLPIIFTKVKDNGASKKRRLSPPQSQNVLIKTLQEFLGNYFCLNVEIMTPVAMSFNGKQCSLFLSEYVYEIDSKKIQTDIALDVMQMIDAMTEHVPSDGFCILGVTDQRIYEEGDTEEGELLGRATGDRAGVISLHNALSKVKPTVSPKDTDKFTQLNEKDDHSLNISKIGLTALFNISAHETMHMLGLDHCVYFSCIMNAWSDTEADRDSQNGATNRVSPLRLCPIDMKKLALSLKLDVLARYRQLEGFYKELGLTYERNLMKEMVNLAWK